MEESPTCEHANLRIACDGLKKGFVKKSVDLKPAVAPSEQERRKACFFLKLSPIEPFLCVEQH